MWSAFVRLLATLRDNGNGYCHEIFRAARTLRHSDHAITFRTKLNKNPYVCDKQETRLIRRNEPHSLHKNWAVAYPQMRPLAAKFLYGGAPELGNIAACYI